MLPFRPPGRPASAIVLVPLVEQGWLIRLSDTRSSVDPVAGYRPWLDGVRGVAVLLVVAEHVGEVSGTWLPAGLGETGVGLFFGLSGYLITGLLLDEYRKDGRVGYGAFYLRRAARLLPALVVMLVVACAAFVRLGRPDVLRDAPFALFYLANYLTVYRGDYLRGFGQTWSLAVEEHFYLFWPVVLVFLLRRRPVASVVRWTLVACAAALVWRCVLVLVHGPELLIYHGSLERMDALLYGCAAALGVRAGWRPGRWWGWGAVAALVAAVLVSDQGVVGMTVVQAAVGLSSAALVVSLDHRAGWLRHVLSWRPVVWVGVVSYGIYLWHWPLLAISVLRFGPHGLALTALVGFVLSTIVAAASYYCLERPVRTAVRGWSARRSRSGSR